MKILISRAPFYKDSHFLGKFYKNSGMKILISHFHGTSYRDSHYQGAFINM